MKVRNWIALALGTAIALGGSYAAYTLATFSWNQVVDYRGPYAKAALPTSAAPADDPARPRRVVYVIVDGLRDDASRAMPALQRLRVGGFDAVVQTAQPSLSFPNWTTLLSGAPQRISGVTTNWFEGRVPVETLVDTALRSGRGLVVAAPTDFEQLYGVQRAEGVFLRDWTEDSYMSGEIVDHAISLAKESTAALVLVHLPDIDEAGHRSGGASTDYRDTATKVDADLGRLVEALQDGTTTFVVASDHGHIDTGGHGGWEPVVTRVPVVLAGPDIRLGTGTGAQDQVASTVAFLAGLPVPRNTIAKPLDATVGSADGRFETARLAALAAYGSAVASGMPGGVGASTGADPEARFEQLTEARLAAERADRLPVSLAMAVAALAVVAAIGLLSWRALVAALAGTVGYYAVYNALYFGLHRYGPWSLSSFNSESMLKGFMNARMIEAIVAGVIAAAIAADVYLFTRTEPRRPTGVYLAGWLTLGTATVLTVQATLALQVAWYLWRWGAALTWYIPDLASGFKYDLDLIQATAIGAVALIGPVVTYLVGRYHPVRKAAGTAVADRGAAAAPADEGA